MKRLLSCVLLLSQLIWPGMLQAAEQLVSFDTPEQDQLYQSLLREYRCLKCQNQNLADSHASLAADLRREIREQILAGKTVDDIDDYLVARYGEFVLYRPRFNSKTAILWIGPFVLLLIALTAALLMVWRRSRTRESASAHESSSQVDKEQQERLKLARQYLDD